MSEKKKTPLEAALEKDCMLLIVASIIASAVNPGTDNFSTKCRGSECAQFDVFTTRCGFSK